MSSLPTLLSLARPGTLIAVPQVPLTSLTTNALTEPRLCENWPLALQLPGVAQDTDPVSAPPPEPGCLVPGTWMAVPQVPLVSVTTNAWSWKDRSVYAPPALQKPAELQDIVKVLENLPWFSAPRPGTGMALPHVPPVSLATHACSLPVGSTDSPPAAQLPAEAHDIEPTSASPCGARPAVPGT